MIELPDARGLSPESLELVRRMAVRAVVELGMTQKEAARLVGVGENAVGQWCAAYQQQGVDAFDVQPQGRPTGTGRSLKPQQEEEIRQAIRETVPEDHDIPSSTWTRPAVAELIGQLCGVDLSDQGVGNYLRRWNMTPQKPARHAREQDPEEVEEFLEETLPEVIEKAEQEEGELHFADETGIQLQDQIGASYAPCGETPVLELPKTRMSENMISSVTPGGDLFYWQYSGTMNAKRFIHFLEMMVEMSADKIFLFADRHPSHTAKAVEQWLEDHASEIEITWLPRYSPEYNPDEFANNDLKQNLKHAPLPEHASDFRKTIQNIMDLIKTLPERIQGYFKQSKLNLAGPYRDRTCHAVNVSG